MTPDPDRTFGGYASCYDLLYGDKDYVGECDYVERLFEKFAASPVTSVLDIGCGTGRHARELARRGYDVCGIDRSPEMIACAGRGLDEKLQLRYEICDAATCRLGRLFDAAVSLFHVFSYQADDTSALSFLQSACAHVRQGGLLIFDFWHGPAVLSQRPQARVKRLESSGLKITRTAEPSLHERESVVEVRYELIVENAGSGARETIRETHRMRYFFSHEIESLLARAGFRHVRSLEWLTMDRGLSGESWSGAAIARREG